MGKYSLYLPQDLWTQIFHRLDEQNLEELSLVSKQFLAITNRLKMSLKIVDETLPSLGGILRRFQYLESITICVRSPNPCNSNNFYADILHKISESGLYFKGRTNLKKLNLGGCYKLDKKVSIAIAVLFPWLEEISFPRSVSFELHDFQELQLQLKALKKVSFKYHHLFPSNESLISLSLNCVNLEEIDMRWSYNISQETIGFMMRHSPRLAILKLPSSLTVNPNASLSIQNSIAYSKNLHSIFFPGQYISKEVVCSFIEANLPLQKLHIRFWGNLPEREAKTINLLPLFRAYSSIQHLLITGNHWISDCFIKTISQYLTKLTHIDLTQCIKLTAESFFILTKNCHSLEEINMSVMRFGGGEVFSTGLHKHEKLRYLNLSYNKYLDDMTLRKFLSVCPNLISIDMSNCTRLTKEGVLHTLKTCVLLEDLKINGLYNVVNIFGKYCEDRTVCLKLLEVSATTVSDKNLSETGNICTYLECLDIRSCERVTNIGVMEVVIKCKNLKKIYVEGCRNLYIEKLLDMVLSKPWIKQNVLRFG